MEGSTPLVPPVEVDNVVYLSGQYWYPHLLGVGTSAGAASVENPVALYVLYVAGSISARK